MVAMRSSMGRTPDDRLANVPDLGYFGHVRKGLGLALLVLGLAFAPASHAVTVGVTNAMMQSLPANPGPTPDHVQQSSGYFSPSAGCDYILPPPGSPPPPSCTFFGHDVSGAWTSQVPRGQWVIRTARVRTGPRTGPMVFTVIRATRSQAGAGGLICCRVPVESQVFTPAPNSINTVPVNLPVTNTVDVINGEPIETVDYLGISLLTLGSSAPAHIPPGGTSATTSFIAPAARQGQERLQDGAFGDNILLVNGEADPAGAAAVAALSAFRLGNPTFRAAGRGGSLAARAKVGTRINYALSRAAPVTFKVQRRKGGRKVGRKCKKPTRRNRSRKRCNLTLKGSFVHSGGAGANSFRFTGRLRGRKLRRGRYVLVARPAGGKASSRKFRIVR